jgi:uncharacterized membrane protein YdfJ with MMPL/SSD domain
MPAAMRLMGRANWWAPHVAVRMRKMSKPTASEVVSRKKVSSGL